MINLCGAHKKAKPNAIVWFLECTVSTDNNCFGNFQFACDLEQNIFSNFTLCN
jgi:hypothetical protein